MKKKTILCLIGTIILFTGASITPVISGDLDITKGGNNSIFGKLCGRTPLDPRFMVLRNNRLSSDLSTKSNNAPPEILWSYDLRAPSFGSAATGDIDKDGYLEIVFGTYFNDEHVYALNAEDGTLLWKYDTNGCNDASPAIADVDLDGELEVILPASSPSTVYCFDGESGKVEWSTFTGTYNCIDSPPAVADVDADGKPEIILGTFNGYVFCLNGEDGSIHWRINLGTDSFIQSGPNILDLNGDGSLDVVVAQFGGDCRVYALNGNDGSVIWFSDLPQDWMYHGGSFGDIDNDGKPEIAIGCYDGYVYVLNGEDGSLNWKYNLGSYILAPTSLADLNNDGKLEVVAATYDLTVLSYDGRKLWSYPTNGLIWRGATISDIDDNGILDVVFGSEDGIVRVLRGDNGEEIWTIDLEEYYQKVFEIDHAPIIADFNNDGKIDIFVVGGYGVYPEQDNYGHALAIAAGEGDGPYWPMFRYDLRHSACIEARPPGEPPLAPTITGPTRGKAGEEYEYTFSTTDPEGDHIYYYVEWDDGTNTSWLGPFDSGEEIILAHTWSKRGTYIIRAKAKDVYGEESAWGTLEVSMPKTFLLLFLKRVLALRPYIVPAS